jgi:hypothetical protein
MRLPRPTPERQDSSVRAGFTLAEVMAAMLFLIIVVPVAIGAIRVAGRAGESGARRIEAARVADRILNETVATTNDSQAQTSGVIVENGHSYRWTLQNDAWAGTPLRLLTAEVTYSLQDRESSVLMSTVAEPQ